MIEHSLAIGIRYGETDQMGYVHHSNYGLYLEEARMDLFYVNGIDIQEMEKEGIILPVVEIKIRYLSPLHFGDTIIIHTTLESKMKTRLLFRYRIINQHKKLIARAETSLVLADKITGKLFSDSEWFIKKLELAEI